MGTSFFKGLCEQKLSCSPFVIKRCSISTSSFGLQNIGNEFHFPHHIVVNMNSNNKQIGSFIPKIYISKPTCWHYNYVEHRYFHSPHSHLTGYYYFIICVYYYLKWILVNVFHCPLWSTLAIGQIWAGLVLAIVKWSKMCSWSLIE